jgi:hypothetical protein
LFKNVGKSGLPFGLFETVFLKYIALALSWPFFYLEEKGIFLGLFWSKFNKTLNIL